MRRIIRSALYHARKYDLGCPTEEKCPMFAREQEAACTGCPKHLTPVQPPPPPIAGGRIAFLVRLESMVAVGCKFAPDDLTSATWDELIWLRIERDKLDEVIRERKSGTDLPPSVEARRAEVRKLDKIPPPGQRLFPRGK